MNQSVVAKFDRRHHLIAILIKLAEIDGLVVQKETDYIASLAKQMKIRKEEFSTLVLYSDKFTVRLPETESDRVVYLFHILKVIIVDDKISDCELNSFFKLGELLNLNSQKVEKVGQTWFKFVKSDVSLEAFLIYWDKLSNDQKIKS